MTELPMKYVCWNKLKCNNEKTLKNSNLMGPPLKARERWPPWVGDGQITHYLWTSSSPCGHLWVWKQTRNFLPCTPRFQDLILESSGWKANTLAMSYRVLLLRLVKNDYQNKYFTVIILEYVFVHSTHLLTYSR